MLPSGVTYAIVLLWLWLFLRLGLVAFLRWLDPVWGERFRTSRKEDEKHAAALRVLSDRYIKATERMAQRLFNEAKQRAADKETDLHSWLSERVQEECNRSARVTSLALALETILVTYGKNESVDDEFAYQWPLLPPRGEKSPPYSALQYDDDQAARETDLRTLARLALTHDVCSIPFTRSHGLGLSLRSAEMRRIRPFPSSFAKRAFMSPIC